MKLYLDYNKLYKSIFIVVLLFLPIVFSYAQTASDLQVQIGQKNADIDRLEQEIQAYQDQLNSIGKQKNSLAGSISELDLTRKKLVADISVTEKKIEKTNLKIQSLNKDITHKKNSISNNTDAIVSGIKKVFDLENQSFIENVLSKDDFTSIWVDVDNMITVREKIIDQTRNLQVKKIELEDTRKDTLDAKNELLTLKSKLSDQRKIVEQNTKEKKQLLAYTKNNEANYQKLLSDSVLKKDALEKELRDYESKLVYILDPSKLPKAGIFSWPLDYIYITQLFGKTVDSKRLYASGSHGGVDFRASVGTPVKAMGNGVVAGVGDTDVQCFRTSFGKYIFIKYDNGLSAAYGHLSLVKMNIGDRVVTGQVVAYSGNTGYSTGPHLHVSLYAPGAAEVKSIPSKSCIGRVLTQPIAPINGYLDPMYYLPAYTKPK